MKLIIKGQPIPQGRPRFANRGKFTTTYDPPKSKAYKEEVKRQASEQYKKTPITGALKCCVSVYRPLQKNGSKKLKKAKLSGEVRPIEKPDVDNYFKSVTDGMKGIVWKDDNQIVDAEIHKYYSDQPRVEVEIEELEQ